MSENIPFEKKELIIVVHNPNNLPVIDFHELKELQGNLKITTPAKIEKLKKSIVKYGIFVPKFIWIDNNIYYIEDGHQTITAIRELEKGGYTVPPIPYVEIQAKDRKAAGEKLLMINSRFADINPETSFFKDFDIGLEFMDEIEIPELELDFEGGEGDEVEHAKLIDKFIVPPFSVLDTRQGYWQDRKAQWRVLISDKGETREDALTGISPIEKFGADTKSVMAKMAGVSLLDPVLAECILSWFNIEKGTSFDPFAGDTVFGFVSGRLGHPFIGIELRSEQVEINQVRCNEYKLPVQYITDDGLNVSKHIKEQSCDLLFSCPPYYDLEKYSELPNDASNQKTYAAFLDIINKTFMGAINCLKPNRFAVIVCSDIRDNNGFYRGFPGDIKHIFKQAGMILYNDIVLINSVGTAQLRVKNHMRNRKVVKLHQNVLVFFKGDPKTIKDNYKEIQVEWDDTYQ